ncbi:MAG: amidohydrolase family protein, partial [Anaerolineales bacterium]|nr:amidohydrolase family protein [Anaerolineales bacterium]
MMIADLIVYNGRFHTQNSRQPTAQAAAVANGRFLAVGTDADVRPLAGPRTTVIDAAGRLVLPGLIDAHVHFVQHAVRRQQVSLFGVRDLGEVLRRVE